MATAAAQTGPDLIQAVKFYADKLVADPSITGACLLSPFFRFEFRLLIAEC